MFREFKEYIDYLAGLSDLERASTITAILRKKREALSATERHFLDFQLTREDKSFQISRILGLNQDEKEGDENHFLISFFYDELDLHREAFEFFRFFPDQFAVEDEIQSGFFKFLKSCEFDNRQLSHIESLDFFHGKKGSAKVLNFIKRLSILGWKDYLTDDELLLWCKFKFYMDQTKINFIERRLRREAQTTHHFISTDEENSLELPDERLDPEWQLIESLAQAEESKSFEESLAQLRFDLAEAKICLETIPDEHKTAREDVRMNDFEGKNRKQVEQITGRSSTAIGASLSRGRVKLDEVLRTVNEENAFTKRRLKELNEKQKQAFISEHGAEAKGKFRKIKFYELVVLAENG